MSRTIHLDHRILSYYLPLTGLIGIIIGPGFSPAASSTLSRSILLLILKNNPDFLPPEIPLLAENLWELGKRKFGLYLSLLIL
jgi:hypothetical protein